MDLIDSKFIGLVSSRLDRFKKVKANLYNFRCPICGDSQKHKNKARGYFYKVKTQTNFKCHNCGASMSFSFFLKRFDESLHKQFVMEKFTEGFAGVKGGSTVEAPKFDFQKPKFRKKDICDELTKISELNTTHRAKKYLINRGINEDTLSKLYYCPNFKEWTNKHKKIFDNTKHDDQRIIIPLRHSDGQLFGYQGRSLDPTSKMRYITVMLDEDAPKLYGLEKSIPKNLSTFSKGLSIPSSWKTRLLCAAPMLILGRLVGAIIFGFLITNLATEKSSIELKNSSTEVTR